MFNQTILQFLPTLLSMLCVLLEDFQVHQAFAVKVAQGIEVDELLAKEEFQEFPVETNLVNKSRNSLDFLFQLTCKLEFPPKACS